MNDTVEFEGFEIKTIPSELEMNYEVSDAGGYLFRLVPGYAGFGLSAIDQALGIEPDDKLITRISDFIVRNDA